MPDEIVKSLELKLTKDELELSGTFLKETIKSKVTLDEKARTFDFETDFGAREGQDVEGAISR